jgi:hypothetical protein
MKFNVSLPTFRMNVFPPTSGLKRKTCKKGALRPEYGGNTFL